MSKTKILVTQSSIPELNEYTEEIKSIFATKWLTNSGEKHKQLKSQLKKFFDMEGVSLLTNGHMALYSGIHCMDFKSGGEIITTPFSFSSTTHTIIQNGLKPVFCDINEEDYNIDVSKIEELITDKTVAILPVHVYGHICDVEEIDRIAKKHNLKVIYDAAHTFGIKYKNKSIAHYGDMCMFSFHATKVFNTIEGGCLTYKDVNLENKINRYKNFGIFDQDHVVDIGINAKMNEFCAAMGICNLRHFGEEIKKRKIVYERYLERLQNVQGLKVSDVQKNVEYNYAYFPVVFDKEVFGKSRDEVRMQLEKENIFTRKYFYPLISDYECYKDKYNSKETPIAKKISDNVLTLPMYANLALEDVDKICNIILKK